MYSKHIWHTENHYNFGYAQYLPKDFDVTKEYPLVFFLHGAGERGDNLDLAVSHSYMKQVKEKGRDFPFIFIAPQCPSGKYWGCYIESLIAFLDYITEALPIDKKRIYLTGLSMGGTGAWLLSMACPEKFAAIAPVCGSGICWYAEAVKDIPIFMVHGDCDTIIPINESINMLHAVNSKGGNAKLHICHGVGHGSFGRAYGNDELLNWMLEQSK